MRWLIVSGLGDPRANCPPRLLFSENGTSVYPGHLILMPSSFLSPHPPATKHNVFLPWHLLKNPLHLPHRNLIRTTVISKGFSKDLPFSSFNPFPSVLRIISGMFLKYKPDHIHALSSSPFWVSSVFCGWLWPLSVTLRHLILGEYFLLSNSTMHSIHCSTSKIKILK